MTSKADIGMNVRRARVMAGLTQDAAAEKSGLTRVAYRSIESGESAPREGTLEALAAALGVKVGDVLRPAMPLPRARFRSLKRMYGRDEILLTIARQLDDYLGLEEILNCKATYRLGHLSKHLRGGENRPRRAAELVRGELELGDEPIRDITGLLEEVAGVKVTRFPIATDSFFGLAIAEDDIGPAIAVNTWDRISVERWIFSAAHELGHLILHGNEFDATRADEDLATEREANTFASYFLMPATSFGSEWEQSAGGDIWDRVMKIKHIFGVSYKTVLYRIQDERQAGNVWMVFQAASKRHLGRTLGKTDEPEPLPGSAFGPGAPEHRKAHEPRSLAPEGFTIDRRSKLIRMAIEGGEISLARGAEILGVDLRDMRTLKASWV
jgi:Zn-dependent peptidase ImmA (M78 family)/DNA-binding XRE family transcriptional regulator